MSPRFERRPSDRDRRRDQGGKPEGARKPRPRKDWSERRPTRGSEGEGERSSERRWSAPRRDDRTRQPSRRFGSTRPEGRRFEPARRQADRPRSAPRIEPAAVPAAAQSGVEQHSDTLRDDLVWGRHAALAVLESGRPIHRIWCTPEMRFTPRFLQLLRETKAAGVLVEEVTWARLGQLTAGAVHQGIVLQTAAADTLDLESLIEGCAGIGEPPLLMALDGITDPQNLGAIARSAEALGAHGLVLPQRRSAGLTGSVAKVAAGALEHLPVARVVNLNRALERLKQEGYRVVGLAAEGSVSLEQADLDGPMVLVTGSEGDGLSMLTRRHCDQLVSIPLRGATASLNASVASALLLYEVARRGWMRGLRGGDPAPRLVRPQLPSPAPAGPQPEPPTELVPEPEQPLQPQPQPQPEPVHPVDAGLSSRAEAGVWPLAEVPPAAAAAAGGPAREPEPVIAAEAEGPPSVPAAGEPQSSVPPAPVPTFMADVDLGSLGS
ncbi:23S rRNA (guanosine(2251)-2'-O)-methyltransferase RlmB [Cyanobium sp. CH-040]|uniref:23S rRNA (guanosine(2251)-2'-O)-methyltransferase RlmB n=1 Tax=Cyanobium sp. CH-040 TaxID=2823708 RepID=UPI0020CDF630|nr:23S rRNA (guanosine(2251)-2'-O)-methyltransferase RlmB [Cyanobium sp. CH-040]